MINHTAQTNLLYKLQKLVQAHRRAFKQARPFWRAVGLVMGEVFNFGRHTVTQDLLTLGMNAGDWSGWYRLFSRERFEEEKLSQCLLEETLKEIPEDEPYCLALDVLFSQIVTQGGLLTSQSGPAIGVFPSKNKSSRL